MKQRLFLIILIICLGSLLVQSSWAESVKFVEAKIKKDLIIGGESNDSQHILADISEVKIYNGKLYILDSKACCMNIYDNTAGKFLSTFSGKGSGPKELLNPLGFTIAKKNIYIANTNNSRIEIFDMEGSYKGSFKLSQPPHAVYSDLQGNLLILFKQNNCLVQKYTPDGKFLKSIVPCTTEKNTMIAGIIDIISLAMGENGEFFVIYSYKNQIDKYDRNGKLLFSMERPLTFEYKSLKPTKTKDGGMHLSAKSLCWTPVYKSKILYVITSQGEEDKTDTLVDMIDNSGKYLGSFKLPISRGYIYFDPNGKTYLIDGDELTITKCDLWISGKTK